MFVEGNSGFSPEPTPLAKDLTATLYKKGFPDDPCLDLLPSTFKKDIG
jgi:hypothetical protein